MSLAGVEGVARPTPFSATTTNFGALQLTGLTPLIRRTDGVADVRLGLIDGPIVQNHPGLATGNIQILGTDAGTCRRLSSAACRHGTFIAGLFAGKRGEFGSPGLCPGCSLLVRPLFDEHPERHGRSPAVHADALAAAVIELVNAGVDVINISAALGPATARAERKLRTAFDYAGRCGVVTVAAAGNGGSVGGSAILRHHWVIPVAACDNQGRPAASSNLGASLGRSGLSAPGVRIDSLSPDGGTATLSGTSVAVPFVTGTIALLLSLFPTANAAGVKWVVLRSAARRRSTIVPPVLNAQASFNLMADAFSPARGG
jgi:subtilisin family serine protease